MSRLVNINHKAVATVEHDAPIKFGPGVDALSLRNCTEAVVASSETASGYLTFAMMYSLHDITSTCVKLENSDSTFTRENLCGVAICDVKVEKTEEPCNLQIHQVMSRNEVVLQSGLTTRQKASSFEVNNSQHGPSPPAAQIPSSFRELSADQGKRGLSSKMDTKGQKHVNQGFAHDYAPSNPVGTQVLSPTERMITPENVTIRKGLPNDSTIPNDQIRDNTRVSSHQICTQMSAGYQTTSPNGIPYYQMYTTDNMPTYFQEAQGEVPVDTLAAMSGYKQVKQETLQRGNDGAPSPHQEISHQVDSQGGTSGHQMGIQDVPSKQLQKQGGLSSSQIDAHNRSSGYRISNQGEILNHQIGSQHEISFYETGGAYPSKSGHQIEEWNEMSTLPIVSLSGLSDRWCSYNRMSTHQIGIPGEVSGYMLSGQGATFTDLVEKLDKKPFQQVYSQNGMPSHELHLQNGMSTHQVVAQDGTSNYQENVHYVNSTHTMGSVAQTDITGRPPPPYQMGTDELMPGHPRLNHETRPPLPITDYDNIRVYQTGFQENIKHERMQFHHMDSLEMKAAPHNNTHTCHCSCHLSSQHHSSHFPAFGLENQRPSVIMVPVAKSNFGVPVTSQFHSKGYLDDSDSSDESDNERKDKYFRRNIDGTTAKFKLTKDDWKRIPINSFPSGGRLLSGDWTRIFLSKVKESNPWCSLRFKNNHVRSENSRKIHSAVFFRGGAECKRPECNVKVRFVIRKEKGKYVEVTYVGNVCHRGQPSGSGVMNDRGRNKRVRRPRSLPD